MKRRKFRRGVQMEGQDRGKDRRRSSITAVALPRHGFFINIIFINNILILLYSLLYNIFIFVYIILVASLFLIFIVSFIGNPFKRRRSTQIERKIDIYDPG